MENSTLNNNHYEKSKNIVRSSIPRNISYGELGVESKVLVIYTGGTIGMIRNKQNVLEPIQNSLVRRIRKYPHLHDEEYAQKHGSSAGMGPLYLPYVSGESRRVIYTIIEYDPLLDSSNMTNKDWAQIAEDIKQSYIYYDGFVILHGTDTLSYTASALSFMLENLGKTVIITGSQIPIFETRTDGKDNFTSALIIAGNYIIPEVCVIFGSKLMRGNRTIKISCASLEAFDTPNVPPIAKIGIHVEIDYRLIHRPCTVAKFTVHSELNNNVGILRIFPSISVATIKAFLQPPIQGVVLQTFGSGNIPSNRNDLVQELIQATERGVIIVNCTQCTTGSVNKIYATGQILHSCGVITGYDMTPEAALTKLSYILGKDEWSLEDKKQMMKCNLRGELTLERTPHMQDCDLVEAVARSLHLTTEEELSQLGRTLFPAMVNMAVLSGDKDKLDTLKGYGANLAAVNYDNRTALHIACCLGNEDMVNHLLFNGVSVHEKDRYDRTPLMEAISKDNHEIIKMLVKCGAHLNSQSERSIGEHLCAAAARNNINRLESYRLAGVCLSQPDSSRRTALHVACLHGHMDVVEYILNFIEILDVDGNDLLGLSAMDYAKRGNHPEIMNLLQNNNTNEIINQNGFHSINSN